MASDSRGPRAHRSNTPIEEPEPGYNYIGETDNGRCRFEAPDTLHVPSLDAWKSLTASRHEISQLQSNVREVDRCRELILKYKEAADEVRRALDDMEQNESRKLIFRVPLCLAWKQMNQYDPKKHLTCITNKVSSNVSDRGLPEDIQHIIRQLEDEGVFIPLQLNDELQRCKKKDDDLRKRIDHYWKSMDHPKKSSQSEVWRLANEDKLENLESSISKCNAIIANLEGQEAGTSPQQPEEEHENLQEWIDLMQNTHDEIDKYEYIFAVLLLAEVQNKVYTILPEVLGLKNLDRSPHLNYVLNIKPTLIQKLRFERNLLAHPEVTDEEIQEIMQDNDLTDYVGSNGEFKSLQDFCIILNKYREK